MYDFFAGLNPEFHRISVQILVKEIVPLLNETISLVKAEESRWTVMLEPQTVESLALNVTIKTTRKASIELPNTTPEYGRADFTKGGQQRK